jgi:hypothetical protein
MKKTFNCVELKRKIQEELWLEGGGTIEGFKKVLFNKTENELYKFFIERQEKAKQLKTA